LKPTPPDTHGGVELPKPKDKKKITDKKHNKELINA
jgi:hypothetical protein